MNRLLPIAIVLALSFVAQTPVQCDEKVAVAPMLDRLEGSRIPVVLNFRSVTLGDLFASMGSAAGFEATLEDSLTSVPVAISLDKVELRQALQLIADEHGLLYEVPDSTHLVVRSSAGARSPAS